MSRAGCITSAAMPPWRTRCAPSHSDIDRSQGSPDRVDALVWGLHPPAHQAPRAGGGTEHKPLRRWAYHASGGRLQTPAVTFAAAARRWVTCRAAARSSLLTRAFNVKQMSTTSPPSCRLCRACACVRGSFMATHGAASGLPSGFDSRQPSPPSTKVGDNSMVAVRAWFRRRDHRLQNGESRR